MLSAIVKVESIYSIVCKKVKQIPSIIVKIKVIDALIRFFNNKQRWDHVTVNPDDSKIIVFNNGMPNGLMVLIPILIPISTEGESLL